MTRQGPVDFCGMLVGRLVRRTAELLHEGCFSCRWEFEVGLGGMTKMTRRKSWIGWRRLTKCSNGLVTHHHITGRRSASSECGGHTFAHFDSHLGTWDLMESPRFYLKKWRIPHDFELQTYQKNKKILRIRVGSIPSQGVSFCVWLEEIFTGWWFSGGSGRFSSLALWLPQWQVWISDFCVAQLILLMASRNPGFTHQLRLVVNIPLFPRFYISQVVQDFFHRQYQNQNKGEGWFDWRFLSPNSFTVAVLNAVLSVSALAAMLCPPPWSCLCLVSGLASQSPSLFFSLGCCVRLPGLVFVLSPVLSPNLSPSLPACSSAWDAVSGSLVLSPLLSPSLPACSPNSLLSGSHWDAVSVVRACLKNFMCDSCNCLGSTVV